MAGTKYDPALVAAVERKIASRRPNGPMRAARLRLATGGVIVSRMTNFDYVLWGVSVASRSLGRPGPAQYTLDKETEIEYKRSH
jgi:hypothetical protein